jgi:hypothetical protein
MDSSVRTRAGWSSKVLVALLAVTVLMMRCGSAPPDGDPDDDPTPTENTPPTVNAGANQVVSAGDSVTLDGSGSSDPDGDALSFSWAQSTGTAVSLSGTTESIVTFTAPANGTTLTFELTVSDGESSSVGQTMVTVHPVDTSAKIVEIRQPSILDDPAVTGDFPEGWTFPTQPDVPNKPGKGAAGWIDGIDYAPTAEVELAPGATHEVELATSGSSVLIGSAKWIGTAEGLTATLAQDGVVLVTGATYSIGPDRGGSEMHSTTTGGGQAVLSVTNTSEATVSVRMILGAYAL